MYMTSQDLWQSQLGKSWKIMGMTKNVGSEWFQDMDLGEIQELINTTPGTSYTTETKTVCIRRVREMATRWLYCPSLRPVQHHMESSSLSLWFLQWEKRSRENNQHSQSCPALWVALWKPLFWSCTTRIAQESAIWLWRRKGEGLEQSAALGRQSLFL